MCLRKLFCRHRKLTAIGIYEPNIHQVNIVCKCDRCGAEVEFEKNYLQQLRHKFRAEVDVSAVVDSPLWCRFY